MPALAHDVKDPVCRMTVDTDTTPYQRVVGGKTFYFCSTQCEGKFDKSPGKYVELANLLAAHRGGAYVASLKATQAEPTPTPSLKGEENTPHPGPLLGKERELEAGKPVTLAITVTQTGNATPVRKFEIVHEELMHLILVSSDLTWFEHQHPTFGADGVFRLTWTFPRAGRYYIYADFTPTDGDNQIKRMVLDVGSKSTSPNPSSRGEFTSSGATPVALDGGVPGSTPIQPDKLRTKDVGDTRIRLEMRPKKLVAGQQTLFTYTFTDHKGRPRTDMQPFIGAMGHIFAVSADGQDVVHTHTLHGVAPGSYAATMLEVMQVGHSLVVTPDMDTEHGPKMTFKLTLAKPGVYRVWAQFMRKNRVVTVPFTVRAAKE